MRLLMENYECIELPESPFNENGTWFFSFYDWEIENGNCWLELVESLTATFGLQLNKGTGNSESVNSHGNYKRVRKRLASILENKDEFYSLVIRAGESSSDCGFEAYISESGFTGRKAGIALTSKYSDASSFENSILKLLANKFVFSYGAITKFNTSFSPESYLAGIGDFSTEYTFMERHEYTKRLTRWRDRITSDNTLLKQGYFREICPINYVNKNNLNVFTKVGVSDTDINQYLSITALDDFSDMSRLTVDRDRLRDVRMAMEPSGFILSSPQKLV